MAAEQIKPVYVLYGSDEYLLDAHRREIVARAVGEADPQTCVSVLDASAELADVLDELRTAPFLAPRRVVIIRAADAFVSACRAPLEAYLQGPSDNGTLVLMVSSWPSNTRLYKLVAKVGQAVDCSAPKGRGLAGHLAKAVAKHQKKLAPAAAELLIEWTVGDLAALNTEIEKLALYTGERKTIGVDDVAAVVTSAAGPGAFDLTNAITDGNAPAALKSLGGMLAQRGDEFKTLGIIAWHLRRVLQAQQMLRSGGSQQQVLAKVRMPYAQKQAFLAMVRRRPLRKTHSDFRRLIRADLAMKSGVSPQAAMQELVVGLCS